MNRLQKRLWVKFQGCIYVMPTSFAGGGPEPPQAPQSTGDLPCVPSLFFPVMFHSSVLTSNFFLSWGCAVGWIWTSGQIVSTGKKEGELSVGDMLCVRPCLSAKCERYPPHGWRTDRLFTKSEPALSTWTLCKRWCNSWLLSSCLYL